MLSPEFGPISHQRQRLDDILTHRSEVEDDADVVSTPTDPSGFLRLLTDATREHLRALEGATTENIDQELRDQVADFVERLRGEIGPVSDALEAQRFGEVELFGAAIHYDTTRDIHQLRRLRRTYDEELSDEQMVVLDDLLTTLKHYDVAREYFRTRYLQTQFIKFSRAILLTGIPALVVAHYAVGIIGPDVLTGTTLGVRDLLWFEAATFTAAVFPVLVITSYVARIVTLAETSIFVGPFSADKSLE